MGLLNTRPGGGDSRGSLSVVTILSFSVSMGLRPARSPHSGRSVSGAFSASWLPAVSSDALRAGATPQMGGHAAVVSGMRKGEFQQAWLALQLPAQHGADDGLARQAVGVEGLDVAAGLLGFVAERHEAADRIHFCVAERIAGRCRAARKHAAPPVGDPIAQLDDEALGGLLSDPGEAGEAGEILGLDPDREFFGAGSRQDAERGARTDAVDLDQGPEQAALGLGQETE